MILSTTEEFKEYFYGVKMGSFKPTQRVKIFGKNPSQRRFDLCLLDNLLLSILRIPIGYSQ